MTRRTTITAAASLWALALLGVLALWVANRRESAPIAKPAAPSREEASATRRALREVRRVVVVEGPPDDDPRGVATWDQALTASAASALVDDLRSRGFAEALGERPPVVPKVARVRTLGPKGRNPASPVVATFQADALVFVALQPLKSKPSGSDAITCSYQGKAWLRLPPDGSARKLDWERSGTESLTHGFGESDQAKRWALAMIGPDLAARLGRTGR